MEKRCNIIKIGEFVYVTSSDEIKEGDWCLQTNYPINFTKPIKALFHILENLKGNFIEGIHISCYKKIIASNDPELHKDGVVKIGLPFIEKYITEYNKGNVIKEVNVEYEIEYIEDSTKEYTELGQPAIKIETPKLNSDGTIIIHKVQEVFTKEDMKKAFNSFRIEEHWKSKYFETWFEQNY